MPRFSFCFVKTEHKMAAAYAGAIFCLVAISLFAGIMHFNSESEERSRITFDSFYVRRPDGIGKVKITSTKGSAVLFKGNEEAGGVEVSDYYPFDTDGLTLSKDAKQVGRRSYLETENKMHLVKLRLSTTDAKGNVSIATHVYLTTDIHSKVFDFYEVDGIGPEGCAGEMADSIRWQARKATLSEGWKTARIKIAQVKKDQKAADSGEQVDSINPLSAAKAYLSSIEGCSTDDIYSASTFTITDSYKIETQTFTFIRKDNSAVDVTVNQPIKQDDSGVWAAYAYRIYPPDSLSPVLTAMSYEQIKKTAAYVVMANGGYAECNCTKADAFVEAMSKGTPCQVDLIRCTENQGTKAIIQWVRLVYNGSVGIKYTFYKAYDGTFRYYIPVEFTEISRYTFSSGKYVYKINVESSGPMDGEIFYGQDIVQ